MAQVERFDGKNSDIESQASRNNMSQMRQTLPAGGFNTTKASRASTLKVQPTSGTSSPKRNQDDSPKARKSVMHGAAPNSRNTGVKSIN